ncbi:MAG: cytosine permease [Microbacteriaceae bacterium]|nr:cytosine permease [Microbacteriaceae bacterium]
MDTEALAGSAAEPTKPTDPADAFERYDDDALAAAMTDEAVRLGLTGAIMTITAPGTPGEAVVPASPVTITTDPALGLSRFPAPVGQPVIFAAGAPLPTGEAALPTRRSIRDAEHARARDEAVRAKTARRSGQPVVDQAKVDAVESVQPPVPLKDQFTPSPAMDDPVSGVPLASDFPLAPIASDSVGEFGDRSPATTLAPPAAVAVATHVPVYDLIEPQPYSAALTVIPPTVVPPTIERIVALTAPVADPLDDDGLRPAGTMNPWLQSAAVEVARRQSTGPHLFVVEASGSLPTTLDQRVGRASRLFWLWFAANSSVISLAFGAAIFSLGMSLRQAVVAIFIGVAISFLPLGLGTLAGKWSGQPVMVVSRATFGHLGNILPAIIALISRLFWGAVLLWVIAAATARILVRAGLAGPLTELQLMVIVMAVTFLVALIVAFFGYALFARIQLVLGILSAALIIALVVITWPAVDISTALTVADGPVILVVTGVVLVFSFVGLVWANSSADLARYQRPSSSGGASMLLASFGMTLPAFLLIGYGALLAASSTSTAKGLNSSPIDTIAALLPGSFPVPLIAATALSLLSGVILSIYSGGFALGALGVKTTRSWATVIVGVLVFAVAIALGFTVDNVVVVFRDLATTLAVPVAAWAGIFSAEMILRRRRFDTRSLLARGGIYRDVNWLNFSMLVVASVIGLGFTSASVPGLGWEGYLFTAVGVPLASPLGSTDLGVLVSLALGLLTPLVAGISTIHRQELQQASRA